MLIVGCGSPGRGDDAAGILVARRLQAMGIKAIEHSGDAFSLMDWWRGRSDVILVTAVESSGEVGAIWEWQGPPPETVSLRATTLMGPGDAIALSSAIGALPPNFRCYGVEGTRFEQNTPPASAVLRAVQQVARRIEALQQATISAGAV